MSDIDAIREEMKRRIRNALLDIEGSCIVEMFDRLMGEGVPRPNDTFHVLPIYEATTPEALAQHVVQQLFAMGRAVPGSLRGDLEMIFRATKPLRTAERARVPDDMVLNACRAYDEASASGDPAEYPAMHAALAATSPIAMLESLASSGYRLPTSNDRERLKVITERLCRG